MNWKPLFFRIVGLISLSGGLFAFYEYGSKFFPLFQQFITRTYDVFELFTILSSLFFGALALVLVGLWMMVLRSFSRTWLYAAALPITAWLQELYGMGRIFKMDDILSQSVVYVFIYTLVVTLLSFIHTHWFTPMSHEAMGHVGLEHQKKSRHSLTRLLVCTVSLTVLLIMHPDDMGTTMRMLVSPVTYLLELL